MAGGQPMMVMQSQAASATASSGPVTSDAALAQLAAEAGLLEGEAGDGDLAGGQLDGGYVTPQDGVSEIGDPIDIQQYLDMFQSQVDGGATIEEITDEEEEENMFHTQIDGDPGEPTEPAEDAPEASSAGGNSAEGETSESSEAPAMEVSTESTNAAEASEDKTDESAAISESVTETPVESVEAVAESAPAVTGQDSEKEKEPAVARFIESCAIRVSVRGLWTVTADL